MTENSSLLSMSMPGWQLHSFDKQSQVIRSLAWAGALGEPFTKSPRPKLSPGTSSLAQTALGCGASKTIEKRRRSPVVEALERLSASPHGSDQGLFDT